MNRRVSFRYACGVGVLALLVVAGCGPTGPARSMVTGTVTLDGQPVEQGQILFMPSDGQGVSDALPIAAGKFEGEVAPGSKRVEITATKEIPPAEAGGMPDYVSIIPKEYNTETTLTADVENGGAPLAFDLKSAK